MVYRLQLATGSVGMDACTSNWETHCCSDSLAPLLGYKWRVITACCIAF